MAAAQRWSRKRGWAAASQGAEVVGQHQAASRGGVVIAGPLHISSSVPTEFESMLEEAAVLAPEGVELLLHYLRSRILTRHTHAMLKRGERFTSSHSICGSLCWRLPPSVSTDLGSQWATGTWICSRPAGSTRSTARFSSPRQQPVQEERARFSTTTCCPRRWRIWCNRSKWQKTLPLPHIRQSDSHSQPRLGSRGLSSKTAEAVRHGGASGTATPGGTLRLDLGSRGTPADLELAWLEWLRAAEAAWYRVRDPFGAQCRSRATTRGGDAVKRPRLGAPHDAWWRRW